MRMLLAAASALAFAACGGQTPAEPAAPAAPEVSSLPGPEAAPLVQVVSPADAPALLAGKWQSIDDANSLLTITADGSWTNDYTGDASVHSVDKWRAFPGSTPPAEMSDYTFTPEATYLEVLSGEDKFYYELGDVDAGNFDMFYVGRGNRLAYKRVN